MRKLFSIICTLLATAAMAQAPAFPGAEGHGRYVTGGRGVSGKVYHVTSLADDTNGNIAGTLRWALKQSGPRTIVFDISGIIELKADLTIPVNTTIAGQTAPKPGITLRYRTVLFGGNNIIVRFIQASSSTTAPSHGVSTRLPLSTTTTTSPCNGAL